MNNEVSMYTSLHIQQQNSVFIIFATLYIYIYKTSFTSIHMNKC